MKPRGIPPALAAAVLLGACRSAPEKPAAGGLETHVTLETQTLRPREGDLAVAALRLLNGSDRTVILRDLTAAGRAEAGEIMTWQYAQEGFLQYDPGRDDWLYDRRRASDKPRPVFNSGLLLPGEEIVVRARLRLLGLPKDYALTYFELSRGDVSQMVYFETHEGREVRSKRLVGEELNKRLIPETRRDLPGHRFVIFPHAEQVVPTSRTLKVRVEAALEPRPFGLAAALRKAGLPAADAHTCSSGFDGWVLRHGDSFRLVTPAAVTALPRLRQMERTFHYLDAAGAGKVEIEFLRETKSLFADRYRIVPDPQRGRFYLFLPVPEILSFFRDVREAGLEVDVEMTPEGGGRLLVTR